MSTCFAKIIKNEIFVFLSSKPEKVDPNETVKQFFCFLLFDFPLLQTFLTTKITQIRLFWAKGFKRSQEGGRKARKYFRTSNPFCFSTNVEINKNLFPIFLFLFPYFSEERTRGCAQRSGIRKCFFFPSLLFWFHAHWTVLFRQNKFGFLFWVSNCERCSCP